MRQALSISRSRLLVLLAALGTVLGVAFVPMKQDAATAPAPAESARGASAAQASLADTLPRRPLPRKGADAFPARSWTPPPPPPPTSSPPREARPEPPSNPYRFAGILDQGGTPRVFLAAGDRVYEAIPGELLDGGYRVKSASREAVVLLHVPLNVEQRVENPAVP